MSASQLKNLLEASHILQMEQPEKTDAAYKLFVKAAYHMRLEWASFFYKGLLRSREMVAICLLTVSMLDLHEMRAEWRDFHSFRDTVLWATLVTSTFWFTWSIFAFNTFDLIASITKLSISSFFSCSLSDRWANVSSLFSKAETHL